MRGTRECECAKRRMKNENEAEYEGPRTNRRRELLMPTVEMWRRGGKEPKTSEGCNRGSGIV